MDGSNLPVGVWVVVDVRARDIVSTHDAQRDAEAERDRRNRNGEGKPFNALIAIQPVAHGMGCACG